MSFRGRSQSWAEPLPSRHALFALFNGHLKRARRRQGMELAVRVDAIEHQGVQVHIEPQGGVKPLHEGDGADLGV